MRENIPLLIAKKVMIFLVSVWLLSLAVFCMARLAPGDPLSAYYGERVEKMSVAEKAEARTKLGLDEPLLEQYGVATVPGVEFGRNGENHLRISYATSYEDCQEGLRRIGQCVRDLRSK